MTSLLPISKTASRQNSPRCAFASERNRPGSRAGARVWRRRREGNASGESLQNHFRDYDPSSGRYIQSDPIGLAGGINTYRYASNNSLVFFDRLGLCESTMKTKNRWEDGGGKEEVLSTFTTPPFPIYTWEVEPGPPWNPFDERGGMRKSPLSLGICSKLIGYYRWKFEMYRNIQFKQKFRYVQFCNDCNCGVSGCTDWIKGEPVDIKEKWGFPLVRKDQVFSEVEDQPCVQFATPSRSGPGL